MTVEDYLVENGIRDVPLDSWWEYFEYIKREYESSRAIIFRGQAEAEWKLWSTLNRLEQNSPFRQFKSSTGEWQDLTCPPASPEEHLATFQELTKGRLGAAAPELEEENEWWALAQHHGLATPFLDWTYSPFVALYFAIEDQYVEKNNQLKEPVKRAVFAISTHLVGDITGANKNLSMPFVPRGESSVRLAAQSSLLLRMPKDKHLEELVRMQYEGRTPKTERRQGAILTKITIPGSNGERVECLKYLDKMNINRSFLFPDLDGAAQYVNGLWELNFETLRGYVLREQSQDEEN